MTHDVQLSKSLSWVLRHAAPSLGLKLSSDGFVPVQNILQLNHPRFCKGKSKKDTPPQPKYTVEDVIRVVENNDKQRFRLEYKEERSGDSIRNEGKSNNDATTNVLCIRANQGHSLKHIQSDHLLTQLTNEELSNPNLSIIHGTTQQAWKDHIKHEGLSRMKRNHIHFATGLPPSRPSSSSSSAKKKQKYKVEDSTTPIISGIRSSSEIYIYINGQKCAKDSVPFYQSDNGVILSAGVKEEGIIPVQYFDRVIEAATDVVLWEHQEDDD